MTKCPSCNTPRVCQRREVAAGARLRIALAPDDVAADGRSDPLLLLLLGADFQQCRHQHADALVGQAGIDAGGGELRGDDRRFQHVGFGAEAAVFARNGARDVAVIHQQLLPVQRLLVRPLPPAAELRRFVAVLADERAHLVLQRPMLVGQAQIHGVPFPQPASPRPPPARGEG